MKTVSLPRFSLRARFALGLGTVLLPFFFAAAVGQFYLLPALVEPTDDIVRAFTEKMMPTVRLQLALHKAAMPVNDYLIHADPSERALFARLARQANMAVAVAWGAPFVRGEERELIETVRQEWEQARELGKSLLKMRRPVGDPQAARAMERFDAHIDRAVALLDRIHNRVHGEIHVALDMAHAARTRSIWVTFGAFALALAVSLFAAAALARSVLAPVRTLGEGVKRIGAGDLAHRVASLADDELGRLAEAFNTMADTLGKNRAVLEERAAQLGALNQIAVVITSSLSLQNILDEIMRRGIALTGAKASCIAFYDETAKRFTDWVTQGLSEHFVGNMSFCPGGLADEAFTRGSYILSNDRPETQHKLSRLAREEGLRGFICLPLTTRDRRLGVIYFYRTDRDTFTPVEIELLTTLASLAAQAIENARLYAQSQEQARTDELTGLDNQREFRRRLDEEIERARRYGRPVSLLMLDIDHFKTVNDTHGHPAGDEALRVIAARIRAAVRPTDHTARYGGEEFVVILPETAGAGAVIAAEHIRAAIAGTAIPVAPGQALNITISIGVAAFPEEADAEAELIAAADQALYSAKQTGRNRVRRLTNRGETDTH